MNTLFRTAAYAPSRRSRFRTHDAAPPARLPALSMISAPHRRETRRPLAPAPRLPGPLLFAAAAIPLFAVFAGLPAVAIMQYGDDLVLNLLWTFFGLSGYIAALLVARDASASALASRILFRRPLRS